MSEITKEIRPITTEDGLRGEKHITDNGTERIIEIFLEEKAPKFLKKRIVETREMMVCHRETEILDNDGNVIEKIVEDVNPQEKMQTFALPQTKEVATKAVEVATKEELDGVVKEMRLAVESVGEAISQQNQVQSPSAQALLGAKVKNSEKTTLLNGVFLLAFVVEACVLGWVVFFM